MDRWGHEPVLFEEVMEGLAVRPGGRYVDGTVGAGGHAEGVLERSSPDGCLVGIEADPRTLAVAAERLSRFGDRVVLVRGNFRRIEELVRGAGFEVVDGVLFDLGLSSVALADGERGFSFQVDGPLDMRFDPDGPVTAADLVNGLSEGELARLIWEYGEERRARAIARAIVAARPLYRTGELAEVVARAVGRRGRIHPATRTFQALRMAVNDELGALEEGLRGALEVLAPGGRLVVIAFHSLEDRVVKRFFQRESRDCICPPEQPVCTCGHRARLEVVTRKPIRPSSEEVQRNPRSRSARMRVACKVR